MRPTETPAYILPTTRVLNVLQDPRHAARTALALAKGAWYRMTRSRFDAGRNLRVHSSLDIRGPGRVEFGDDVIVYGDVTIWTHDRNAIVRVGSGTVLTGTRFGCVLSIQLGKGCLIAADVKILDTDFHSVQADRRTNPNAAVRVARVVIEDNVWIAPNCGILPGVTIGKNSVVGFGAVCIGQYPPDVIVAGNPARVVRPLNTQEPGL